jgi:UDP-glucose 4-epimerase
MKILLTGGAGFIGSHTAVALIENGFDPIIVDDFRNSEPFVIKNIEKIVGKKITCYETDIGNKKEITEILQNEKPVGVIHFAADKAVNESVLNPMKYYQNNVLNLINFLEVIENTKINSFVFSSSCTVYGVPDKTPVKETAPIKPAFSPYGYTKQIGERVLTDFFKTKPNSSLTLLRYFNPIGAHPSGLIGELPIGVPSNLVPYITQTGAGKRKKLTVFGKDYDTDDGTCIRDYIHVVDLANAHVASLKKGLNSSESIKIYNVGTGKGASVMDVVTAFEKVSNQKLNYEFGPRREGDVPEIYSDNELIKNKLGWNAKFSLEDCLEHSWKWEKNLVNFKYKFEKKQD